MALRLASFNSFATRFQQLHSPRHCLFILIACVVVWVLVVVIVLLPSLNRLRMCPRNSCKPMEIIKSLAQIMEVEHYVGKSILRKDSRVRTLGLFGSKQCLLLDLDPYHPAFLKHQWDLGNLSCHGGRARVFLKEKQLRVTGRGLRDVSYRAVKLPSGSTADHLNLNGVSYGKEQFFPETVSRLEKGHIGSIAHFLGKCIHPQGESENPVDTSGLMLFDFCQDEKRYVFSLATDGTLKHNSSGKCIVPLKDKETTYLVFSSDCGLDAKFAALENGFVQHLLSRKCMHFSSIQDAPPNEAELVLLPDCSTDLRQRYGWSDHTRERKENISDTELVSSSVISDEFIEVQFMSQESVIIGATDKEYLFQILPKVEIEKPRVGTEQPMNVLLVMFHATSNAQFQRHMPKTYAFLADELDSVFFKGFSVVDDSSKSQLVAMLSGITPSNMSKEDIDSLPWLFKLAKDNGYVTLMTDDKKITAHDSDRLDFKGAPTDHYAAPFWRAAYRYSHLFDNFCIGDRPIYNITLSYVRQFFNVYAKRPKFALAINTELSSWNINALGYADNEMLEFLKWMKQDGHLDNTAVIMFSDHGSRADKMQQTLQGKLEERMPFLSALLPLKRTTQLKTVLSNLKFNSDLIVSPYDVYTTLRNIVSPMKYQHRIGENLLERVTSGSRTCDHLQVPSHWCPCLQVQSIIPDIAFEQISRKIIATINKNLVERSPSCPVQTFMMLKSALRLTPSAEVIRFKPVKNSGECKDCEPENGKMEDWSNDKFFLLFIKVVSGHVYRAVVNYLDGSFHVHPHIDLVEGEYSPHCRHDRFHNKRKPYSVGS